ncbi:hypothetical protein EOV40_007365 [Acetobacter oryzoeni]|uniref:Uncharacterized protein n=1 Tax=Acetobacter oryzoeni TaxID=2500548 RepID=A0A5B9GH25_9PROT|nr:hypothetical protein EOV40_007365 [Acetobacter oryzoeni]
MILFSQIRLFQIKKCKSSDSHANRFRRCVQSLRRPTNVTLPAQLLEGAKSLNNPITMFGVASKFRKAR